MPRPLEEDTLLLPELCHLPHGHNGDTELSPSVLHLPCTAAPSRQGRETGVMALGWALGGADTSDSSPQHTAQHWERMFHPPDLAVLVSRSQGLGQTVSGSAGAQV